MIWCLIMFFLNTFTIRGRCIQRYCVYYIYIHAISKQPRDSKLCSQFLDCVGRCHVTTHGLFGKQHMNPNWRKEKTAWDFCQHSDPPLMWITNSFSTHTFLKLSFSTSSYHWPQTWIFEKRGGPTIWPRRHHGRPITLLIKVAHVFQLALCLDVTSRFTFHVFEGIDISTKNNSGDGNWGIEIVFNIHDFQSKGHHEGILCCSGQKKEQFSCLNFSKTTWCPIINDIAPPENWCLGSMNLLLGDFGGYHSAWAGMFQRDASAQLHWLLLAC